MTVLLSQSGLFRPIVQHLVKPICFDLLRIVCIDSDPGYRYPSTLPLAQSHPALRLNEKPCSLTGCENIRPKAAAALARPHTETTILQMRSDTCCLHGEGFL
jgi:hypothetical protein